MSDDNLSDTSSVHNDEDLITPFLDYHTYNIIHLYEDFKNRFTYNPFFLANLKSTDLTDFFIHLLYYNYNPKQNLSHLKFFSIEYENELCISFNIVNNFLKTCKYNLDYNTWTYFCYKKSDLTELYVQIYH
jgi:hypothetical protein